MSATPVKPGDVLAGKYRVERVLGAGGMGYVLAARHLQLDQLVAMKFLRKGAVDSNSEAGTRFLREAKAAVKLRNEHIAKVFDVGTLESGEPYIVMEHLDGCDLAALAKQRHVLPADEVCEYVMQACEALAEAHSIGIVHRDIKLANLFVTRGPAGGPLVKVLDFGISKTNPFGESEHDMTRTASMLGSPRFMSPEQMRDPRAVDGRSDIWSLGVVIYRLVSGRPPFEADTLGRLLTMVMHEKEQPLASVRKDLPPGFSEVVARCLEKDPTARFTNVAELAYALVPFSTDPARARSAADRIAAVLALPHAPASDISMPQGIGAPGSSRASIPPGASDTGTAAPWAGTHGSGRARLGSRGATIGLGLVLVAILGGSVLKIRHDALAKQAPGAGGEASAPVMTVSPTALPAAPAGTPAPAPSPTTPAGYATDNPAAPPAYNAPIAAVIGASTPAVAPPPTPVSPPPEGAPAPRRTASPPRRGASPPPRPPSPAPAPAPRGESGIPTTRD